MIAGAWSSGAFSFQAIGALIGTIIGYLILKSFPETSAWRWMYATAIIPGILVVAGRFFITDSCHWLVSMGRVKDAENEMHRLLNRSPRYPKRIISLPTPSWRRVLRPNRKKVSIPFSKRNTSNPQFWHPCHGSCKT